MMKKTDPFTAGEFRSPVLIKRRVETPNSSGGQVVSWEDRCTVYCHIENKTGSEPYGDSSSGRIRTFQKWVFTTWWRADIVQTDKIFYNNLYFNIRSTNNLLNRNKFLQIEADAGVEQ